MPSHALPRRILLNLAALGVGVLILEGLLQLGAMAIRATTSDRLAGLRGDVRILCVGDSNTFGVYVEPDASYPRQLESLWARTHPADSLEVLNVGFPGMNSSRVRRDLDGMLGAFQPSLVLLMVGANDFWTRPVDEETAFSPGAWVARHSRLARLLFTARRALDAPELEVIGDPKATPLSRKTSGTIRYGDYDLEVGFVRGRPGPDAFIARALHENLQAIVETARARRTELALLTYASRSGFYGLANGAILSAAADAEVPLIDVASGFAPSCPEEPCPELLFRDHHPTERGYALVADLVASWLEGSWRTGASGG